MFNNYFPTFYFNRVEDIPLSLLIENDIKGIVLDLDNTLINYLGSFSNDLLTWLNTLKENDIIPIILSNSRSNNRVKNIAKKFNIDYICSAKKPNLKGFENATSLLNLQKSNIAIIGDQLFTDIIGGNRFGIKTILVKPISFIEVPEGMIKRAAELPIKIAYRWHKKKSR